MPKKLDIRAKILALMDEMNDNIVERRAEIEGLVLATLSRNHIYLLGQAGVGKGYLIDTFVGQIKGASLFDILMSKDTIRDDVFGPMMLSELARDNYKQKVEGYLPTAQFAFLDEIFKCNSVILNRMLKVLNERKYLNGDEMLDVPLISMFCASNELPEDLEEGDANLMALYDRIVLRYIVAEIEDSDNYLHVMKKEAKPVTTVITLNEIEMAQKEVQAVEVPDTVLLALWDIKRRLKSVGCYISVRKLVWIQNIIKASAWLSGRTEADVSDLLVVKHCLWDTPDQIKDVKNVVTEVADPLLKEAEDIKDAVWEVRNEIDGIENAAEKAKACKSNLDKVSRQWRKLQEMERNFTKQGKDTAALNEIIAEVMSVRNYIKELYVRL